MRIKKIVASLFSFGMAASPLAYATNGMNLSGYGPISESMGGASAAYDNGTAAVMNNPATLGLMQEDARFDAAVGVLAPKVEASMAGSPKGTSTADQFFMPAVGYVRKSERLIYGAAVFSQGGMGTEYSANSFMAAGSGDKVRSEVGVGRFIIPLAYQVNEQLNIGGSVDFVWAGMDLKMALSGQQFGDMIAAFGGSQTYGSASGSLVNAFGAAVGPNPGQLTPPSATGGPINWARVDFSDSNQFTGQAKGNGYAFKLGGTYKVNSELTLGAYYHSKTSLGDLTTTGASMSMNVNANGAPGPMTVSVSGAVSVHNFQWPETFGVGAAYQATEQLLLVADYKRIGWKNVMKNFSMTFTANQTQSDPNASAFGLGGKSVDMVLNQNWDDQNVYELGVAYRTITRWTVRGGLNLANNPIPDKFMNPLFPAIAKNHYSLGLGYELNKQASFDFSYVYVPKVTATNGQGVTVDFGGNSGQLLFSYKF